MDKNEIEQKVIKIFDELKYSENVLDNYINIKYYSNKLAGYLEPIRFNSKEDNELIGLLAKWRDKNQFAFPTQMLDPIYARMFYDNGATNIAKEANANKLALLHFDANIYFNIPEVERASKLIKKKFRDVIFPKDGMYLNKLV